MQLREHTRRFYSCLRCDSCSQDSTTRCVIVPALHGGLHLVVVWSEERVCEHILKPQHLTSHRCRPRRGLWCSGRSAASHHWAVRLGTLQTKMSGRLLALP